MANASSSTQVSGATSGYQTGPHLNQLLNHIASIKMDRTNFLLWKNLAWPILRSYKIEKHLTGESLCPDKFISMANTIDEGSSSNSPPPPPPVLNPEYENWVAVDQLLLGWLYNSMAPAITTHVMGFYVAKDLWEAVQELFGVCSRAEVDYLKRMFQQRINEDDRLFDDDEGILKREIDLLIRMLRLLSNNNNWKSN